MFIFNKDKEPSKINKIKIMSFWGKFLSSSDFLEFFLLSSDFENSKSLINSNIEKMITNNKNESNPL